MPDSTHAQVQRELFIRTFFDVQPPAELAELLASRMRDRSFEPGEVIYERGGPPGPMFFVTSGTVELVAPDEEPWVFAEKAFIGAIDANVGQPHARTARAVTRARAIEMHFEEYLLLLEDFFDFAKATLIQGALRTHQTGLGLAPDIFPAPAGPLGRWLARPRLDDVQRLIALRATRAFGRAPVQSLVTLARHAVEERFPAGRRLFQAGDENRGFVFVVDGLVRVRRDDPTIDTRAGPGETVLGVLAIVEEPYALSADAETDVVTLRIPHEDLYDAMEEHFGLARSWWVYMGLENQRCRQELGRRQASAALRPSASA